MLRILIIGASSAIAHETAKYFAVEGAEFFLVGRSPQKLEIVRDDLIARGAKFATTFVMDANDTERHQMMLENAVESFGTLDVLFIAHGSLGDQKASQASVDDTMNELETNFLSAVSILTLAANYFEEQKRGVIAVISSVAGDRGRGSNYVYGSAMAAKTAFLQGLRNRLAKSNVTVLTIKPGPVDTPMTAHMKRSPTLADPAKVGEDIYKAMKKGQDVLYTPRYWRFIMLVIRNIPEFIFKRMSL